MAMPFGERNLNPPKSFQAQIEIFIGACSACDLPLSQPCLPSQIPLPASATKAEGIPWCSHTLAKPKEPKDRTAPRAPAFRAVALFSFSAWRNQAPPCHGRPVSCVFCWGKDLGCGLIYGLLAGLAQRGAGGNTRYFGVAGGAVYGD